MGVFREVHTGNWERVPLLVYKEEGTHFRSITRQTLFSGDQSLPAQLRYFEIAPGGHSTLERHEHLHSVMILRGRGAALVEGSIEELAPHDLVEIPPMSWHQFRATQGEPFGFLCLVSSERDRPRRPDSRELALLQSDPRVNAFIRT